MLTKKQHVNIPQHLLCPETPHEHVPPHPRDEDAGRDVHDAGVGGVGAGADVADATGEGELLAGPGRVLKRLNCGSSSFPHG